MGEVTAWGFPIWGRMDDSQKQTMAQHVITRAAPAEFKKAIDRC